MVAAEGSPVPVAFDQVSAALAADQVPVRAAGSDLALAAASGPAVVRGSDLSDLPYSSLPFHTSIY